MYRLLHRYTRKVSTIIIAILFSISLWQLATAGWIQGKAIVAQQLLNSSWNRTLIKPGKVDSKNKNSHGQKAITHKPWPWADTWPVAKLIVPQQNIEQIVIAGDSGSSLAFGPGYSLASTEPNKTGTTVISAHRDTHFRFLKELKINEMIYLQTVDKTIPYQVYDMRVVDSKIFKLESIKDRQTLVLVTCYPFDAITNGGSLRYLVYAATPITQNQVRLQVI